MMSGQQSCRLNAGGRIDRNRSLRFTFNGHSFTGYEGDTVASALLANGVRTVGRSFKFHRPRGILSSGVEEPNALLKIGYGGREEPNVRATLQPLYDGLVAHSQNCWPSVDYDFWGCLDRVAGLLPAGFYNKTFMWPNWHWYEGFIRRAAGLGKLPAADDPDYYTQQNLHCDVLICGAGPAGLAAALAAGETGARVILVDQEPGGSLLWRSGYIDDQKIDSWLSVSIRTLEDKEHVTLLRQARAVGFFDHNVLMVSQCLNERHGLSSGPRERLLKIRAKQVILATGAIEQPLLFPNNDRPGIMLASAVSHYANRYAVSPGKRVVIATNNDSAYQAALDLSHAGIRVEAVIDSRPETSSSMMKDVKERGISVFQHCLPLDTLGRRGVRAVRLAQLDTHVPRGFRELSTIQCDALAMSGGWQPAIHLFSQARGKLRYDAGQQAFLPDKVPANTHIVGAANGTLSLGAALAEGHKAGIVAADVLGFVSKSAIDAPFNCHDRDETFHPQQTTITYKSQRQWIDFQHDVTLSDIDLAVRENYVSVEHLKRYTTTGMSVDQGKTSNLNALRALAKRTGKAIEQVGTTTFRPFYMPVTLGAIAGRRRGDFYAAIQRSPVYICHQSSGAVFHDYGHWRRPAAYPVNGESLDQAIQREARAVRKSVGIFDGSSLGKIEVSGTDAAELLNRLYINNVHSLKVGRARYGLMLNENGIVIDDGVFVRLSENHFLVHTTSGNAGHIFDWMEEWLQREWPELDVLLNQVTTQWANVTVSGPKARELLLKLGMNIDLDADSFPHMHYKEGEIEGIPVRVLRASFTGEIGYEVNVPAGYGAALWRNLLDVGRDFDITPYGIESLMVLRTEKGYLHVGVDTDGTTTPLELGWGGAIAKKAADFIGKRSLIRSHNISEGRLQLVGISPLKEKAEVVVGSHIVNARDMAAPAMSQGYVTSACYSPTLKRWVALALLKNGHKRSGETLNLFHADEVQAGMVVDPTFYDPEGACLHA